MEMAKPRTMTQATKGFDPLSLGSLLFTSTRNHPLREFFPNESTAWNLLGTSFGIPGNSLERNKASNLRGKPPCEQAGCRNLYRRIVRGLTAPGAPNLR